MSGVLPSPAAQSHAAERQLTVGVREAAGLGGELRLQRHLAGERQVDRLLHAGDLGRVDVARGEVGPEGALLAGCAGLIERDRAAQRVRRERCTENDDENSANSEGENFAESIVKRVGFPVVGRVRTRMSRNITARPNAGPAEPISTSTSNVLLIDADGRLLGAVVRKRRVQGDDEDNQPESRVQRRRA